MIQWYVAVNGKQTGPHTEETVVDLIRRNEINEQTLVWRKGWPAWQPLAQSGLTAKVNEAPRSEVPELDLPIQKPAALKPQLALVASNKSTSVQTTELPPEAYAGFWIRFGAYALDWFVLLSINMAVMVAAIAVRGPQKGQVIAFFLKMAITFMYFSLLQAKFEGSLGKRTFGLTLLNEDLTPINPSVASRRFIYLFICALPLYAGLIAAAFHSRKQGWHDRWAGTVVVKRRYLAAHENAVKPADFQQAA